MPPTSGPSNPNCAGSVKYLSSPPDFILQYLHNNVRFRVVEWKVEYSSSDCGGAIVSGKDSSGRLVNVEKYGANFHFEYQWTIAYGSGSVQVDRFEPFNNFVGRTIYSYGGNGALVAIRQLDGNQRLLMDARFDRILGRPAAVLKFYDASTGRLIDSTTIAHTDVRSALQERFYLFDMFGQLN
jgi:hypothetical protein